MEVVGADMSMSRMLGDHWEVRIALSVAFGEYVEREYDSLDLNTLINKMTPRQIVDKFFPTEAFLNELYVVCPCLDEDYACEDSVEERPSVVRDTRWKAKRVRAHFTGRGVDVKRRAQLVKGVFKRVQQKRK